MLTHLIVIDYIIILFDTNAWGFTALSRGSKLALIVIYYIILYYTEFERGVGRGRKLVLGRL